MLINNKLLTKNELYVLAVSGGPDSMFLLDKMRSENYNFVVAHVNYKKRIDSDYDEKIVKNYCQKYFLSREVYQVKGLEHLSIRNFQDRARQIRYDFFQKLAKKYQTKYIMVAHHLDDHLETYLLQKQRKSLAEHWGLPTKMKQGKYWILRPLLVVNKQHIYQYLVENKINYATDITNQLPIYQRNITRRKLDNLNPEEKISLEKEIKKRNQELKKIKSAVKIAAKNLIISPQTLRLEKKNEYPQEVCFRLLYFWINQATNGLLQKRKKKLLKEVYKQLFFSQKSTLAIELGQGWKINKYSHYALISSKTY